MGWTTDAPRRFGFGGVRYVSSTSTASDDKLLTQRAATPSPRLPLSSSLPRVPTSLLRVAPPTAVFLRQRLYQRPRRRVRFQLIQKLRGRVPDDDDGSRLASNEPARRRLVQKLQEQVEVPGDVQHPHGLRVIPQLLPRDHL
eukprot:31441-Pelagococcus_subviridis.AAC.2